MAGNGGTPTSTNIRALELFFALYESDKGMTRAELARTIPGYAGLDEKALQETQKRDFDALSAIGVRFEEDADPDQRGRIRIVPDSMSHSTAIEFSGQQMTLIRMAFDVWDGGAVADPEVTQTKLRASSEVYVPATRTAAKTSTEVSTHVMPLNKRQPRRHTPSHPATLGGGIEGSSELVTILSAITRRQPITFTYTSSHGRMERGVDPWNLIIRGRSIYLWGWDHDRQAERLFKLSRIEPPVELIGEAGDAAPVPASLSNPFDDFACEPLLWQRIGSDIPFLADCPTLSESDTPTGWRAVRGRREEWGIWAQRLIAHGTDLVPREPSALTATLREQLTATVAFAARDSQTPADRQQEDNSRA